MNFSMLLLVAIHLTLSSQETGISHRSKEMPFLTSGEEGIFLGRGMNGVVITLVFGNAGSDLRQHVRHLDGRQGRVEPFVPVLGTGPLDGLLDVIGRKDSVDHRNTCLQAHAGHPF